MAAASPSDNVFIGDLPANITKESIEEVFSAYGSVVQCRPLPPKIPGQKASGLVRFASVEEATWVVTNLNGNLAEGLKEPIQVRFANNPTGGSAKGGGGGGGYGAAPVRSSYTSTSHRSEPYGKTGGGWNASGGGSNGDNVFIGNLPEHITREDCEEIFSKYGSVVQCRAMGPKMTGAKASALVRFSTEEEAQWVVDNLNGNLAEGLDDPLIVRFAHNPVGGHGGPGAAGTLSKLDVAPPPAPKPWNNQQSHHQHHSSGGKGKGKSGGGVSNCSMAAVFAEVRNAGLLGVKGSVPQENTLYVSNLPADCTDLDMFKLFCPFGTIAVSGVKAMLNQDGTCKGFGFVDYLDSESAATAVSTLNSFPLPDGRTLHVSTKSAPKNGGKSR